MLLGSSPYSVSGSLEKGLADGIPFISERLEMRSRAVEVPGSG